MQLCRCSLLDVLAGRKDKIGLSGHVLVDGDTQPVNFKCMSGYVIQVRPVQSADSNIGVKNINNLEVKNNLCLRRDTRICTKNMYK